MTDQGTDRPTRITLAEDLNRHPPAWANNQAHHVVMIPHIVTPMVPSPGHTHVLVSKPPGKDIDN